MIKSLHRRVFVSLNCHHEWVVLLYVTVAVVVFRMVNVFLEIVLIRTSRLHDRIVELDSPIVFLETTKCLRGLLRQIADPTFVPHFAQ